MTCAAQGPESSGPVAHDDKSASGSAPSTSGGDNEALKESLFGETDAPDSIKLDTGVGAVDVAIATSFIEKVRLCMVVVCHRGWGLGRTLGAGHVLHALHKGWATCAWTVPLTWTQVAGALVMYGLTMLLAGACRWCGRPGDRCCMSGGCACTSHLSLAGGWGRHTQAG